MDYGSVTSVSDEHGLCNTKFEPLELPVYVEVRIDDQYSRLENADESDDAKSVNTSSSGTDLNLGAFSDGDDVFSDNSKYSECNAITLSPHETKLRASPSKPVHVEANEERTQCQQCGVHCISNDMLSKHITLRHTNPGRFTCPKCRRHSKTYHSIEKHMLIAHHEELYPSTVKLARVIRPSEGTFDEPTISSTTACNPADSVVTPASVFYCTYCRARFLSKEILLIHMRGHASYETTTIGGYKACYRKLSTAFRGRPMQQAPKKKNTMPNKAWRIVRCNLCNFTPDIRYKNEILKHVHEHEPSIFHCLICNEREIGADIVLNHAKLHPLH